MAHVKIALFDAKPYDRSSFDQALKELKLESKFEMVYLEQRLCVQTAHLAKDCQAICAFVNDDLSASVIAELNRMKIKCILMRCAGFDRVDLNACSTSEISVVRVPAYSPYAVAEFAMALFMTLNRKLHKAYNRIRDGNFTLSGLVGIDLHGKTVGVIGTGKIGQCFIDIVIGFGCTVLCYDAYQSDLVKQKPNCKYVSLEELFGAADLISLHVPLLKETQHLINPKTIKQMKKGVYIINTSRGALIDTNALIEALVSGHIKGAGLDVYENEGTYFFRDCSDEEIQDDMLARLSNMRNVVITSHQAFLTQEALQAIATTTLKNSSEYFIEKKQMKDLSNYVAPP